MVRFAVFSLSRLFCSNVPCSVAGSSKNALFVLAPKLRIYRSKSGGNGAYQRLNSKSLTQPRGMGEKFWHDEVTKMVKVYGAPVPDADVAVIIDYLTSNYGQTGA